MKYPWKIYAKGRYVDSGSIEAESEKVAMGLVLIAQADKDRDPDTCYSVTVGERVTTSFGDEFLESAGAGSIDETDVAPKLHSGGVYGPDHIVPERAPWSDPDADPLQDLKDMKERMGTRTGRMSCVGPNPSNPGRSKKLNNIVQGMAARTLDELIQKTPVRTGLLGPMETEVMLECQGCGNVAYVKIPGIPQNMQVHRVSGVECKNCGTTHEVEVTF